jgi:hypothetical protein
LDPDIAVYRAVDAEDIFRTCLEKEAFGVKMRRPVWDLNV